MGWGGMWTITNLKLRNKGGRTSGFNSPPPPLPPETHSNFLPRKVFGSFIKAAAYYEKCIDRILEGKLSTEEVKDGKTNITSVEQVQCFRSP